MTMKIAMLSDLRLSVQAMDPPATHADVVVLAGDLNRPAGPAPSNGRGRFASRHCSSLATTSFTVAIVATTMRELCAHAQGTAVRVLEHDAWQHGGVRFLGCTLW